MNEPLKITVGQINPTLGDMTGNIILMQRVAAEAQMRGANMVVFPELALTGYSPADLLDDALFVKRLTRARNDLLEATKQTPGLYWVVGLPIKRDAAGGKAFFNGLQVILDGEVFHEQHKQLLPTYGVFDEHRHFEPGEDNPVVIDIAGTRVGFLICEDQWNDSGNDYMVNPFGRIASLEPELVISINASPSHVGKRQMRHNIISAACARHKLPLLYVAQVGGHDQLVYDGGSFAVDANGFVVFEAARFATDTHTLTFNPRKAMFFNEVSGVELAPVERSGLSNMEFYRQQIVMGLRDYARRCGFKQVLVGSSGGIDSALTLALAAEALGPENVVAITMPSIYSSEGSVSDSVTLCDNLGVKLHEVPIKDIVSEFSGTLLDSTVGAEPAGLALENLQARVRGTILMTYSNQFNLLVLTTGNKSEISVGYCTLYGDTNGGLGLIGDLYKTEVFALSRHINETAGRELIPVAIIEKAPSAELAPGQKDTDSLPPYEILDEMLKMFIEGRRLEEAEYEHASVLVDELTSSPEGLQVAAMVKRLIARSEYKRRQAPPIIHVRARAFGNGRQVPITAVQY